MNNIQKNVFDLSHFVLNTMMIEAFPDAIVVKATISKVEKTEIIPTINN
jgi:hypothetical protein